MSIRRGIVARSARVEQGSMMDARLRRTRPIKGRGAGGVVSLAEDESLALDLLKSSPPKVDPFRRGKYLHVSDLLGKCVRKIAIAEKFGVPVPAKALGDGLGLTFAMGTALHTYIKSRFAKGHPDKLFGGWECRCGKTKTAEPCVGSSVAKRKCAYCDGPLDQYQEVELFDDEYLIVGSPDITLYLGRHGAYMPVEIKSMNREQFKQLSRPLPDHVMQVVFYWHLLRRKGYAVPDRVSVLYVNKEFAFKVADTYKEFPITPSEEAHRLAPYLEDASEFVTFRSNGTLPPRKNCNVITCADAKECHVAVICFQHTK